MALEFKITFFVSPCIPILSQMPDSSISDDESDRTSPTDPSALASSHEYESEIDFEEEIVWQPVRSTTGTLVLPAMEPVSAPVTILVPQIPYYIYAELSRDREMVFGQGSELRSLVDQMSNETRQRVDVSESEWVSRIERLEEMACGRLREGSSVYTSWERTGRLMKLERWMWTVLRIARQRRY